MINVVMLAMPFLYSAPLTTMIAIRLSAIDRHWLSYNQLHTLLMNSLDQSDTSTEYVHMIAQTKLDIYNIINTLLHLADLMLVNIRWVSGGYFVMDLLFLVSMSFATWKILRALRAQVRTLHNCATRRRRAHRMHSLTKDDKLLSRLSIGGSSIEREPPSSHAHLTSFLKLPVLERCLPSFASGTEVSHVIWNSTLFQDRQEWEMVDEVVLNQKYISINRFTTASIWNAAFMGLISFSYLGLDIVVGKYSSSVHNYSSA